MQHTKKLLPVLIAGALASGSAFATNGYAPHGIGMKSKGMGGVSIAHQGDAVATGGNPAGSAWMDDRADLGVDIFRPQREADISGNQAPLPGVNDNHDGNGLEWFAIPEFGYRRGINSDTSFAISMFGNGGMNTDYKDGIALFNIRPSDGHVDRVGIDLAQLFLVPSLAYKVNPDHSIGVGLNLVASRFKATGLGNFKGVSSSPDNLTNNGSDWAYGAGIRVGWMGKVSSTVTLGATYQSKTWMSEFDDYEGLFAEEGDFDVPANFGAGISWQATPQLVIAADVIQIQYSDVDSLGNALQPSLRNCMYGDPNSCVGTDDGSGFGWDDQTVFKLGMEYMYSPKLTLRAGYNHGDTPIEDSETLFNILAPATVEDHLTLGGTYTLNNGMEITAAYMHAFKNSVDGDGSIPDELGGGEADIEMYQDSFGIAVAWKL